MFTYIVRQMSWPAKRPSAVAYFDNCILLGYYAASSGDSLPTFRHYLPVPSSGVKNPKWNELPVFLYNKTNQMHKFILSWNSTCFAQFVCPSSGVYSLYTQQRYMSYRFVDSFRAGSGWMEGIYILILHESCMTYTIAECTVNILLMMDRETVRNM
jgi:hypothetical protein